MAAGDERLCAQIGCGNGGEPVGQARGVVVAAERDVGLDQQRCDAEHFAHRASAVVDLEASFEHGDDFVEVVATQRAEGAGEGEVGGDGCGPGLLHKAGRPVEFGAGFLVDAAGGVL